MCQRVIPLPIILLQGRRSPRRPDKQGIVSIKVSLQSLDWFTYKLGHDVSAAVRSAYTCSHALPIVAVGLRLVNAYD